MLSIEEFKRKMEKRKLKEVNQFINPNLDLDSNSEDEQVIKILDQSRGQCSYKRIDEALGVFEESVKAKMFGNVLRTEHFNTAPRTETPGGDLFIEEFPPYGQPHSPLPTSGRSSAVTEQSKSGAVTPALPAGYFTPVK